MKIIHHAVWLIVVVIIQTLILNYINIFGIVPNLFLVYVVSVGFICGRTQGMLCGLFFGLAYDIFVGRLLGISMLLFMLIGYFSAVFSDKFYGYTPFYIFCLIGFTATLIFQVGYMFPYNMYFDGGKFLSEIGRIVIPECLLNCILIIPIVFLLKKTIALCNIRI